MMDISADGIVALKRRECPGPNFDFVLYAYDDSIYPTVPAKPDDPIRGALTIGAGHTGADVVVGLTITTFDAEALLRKDLSWVRAALNELCYPPAPMTQNQVDALFSFVYNIGRPLFERSGVLRYINAGRMDKVPDAMRLYNKSLDRATGALVVNNGLMNRRASEIGQWIKGSYVSSATVIPVAPPTIDPAIKAKVSAWGSAVAGAATAIGATVSSTQAQVAATGGKWTIGVVIGVLFSIVLAVVAAKHAKGDAG